MAARRRRDPMGRMPARISLRSCLGSVTVRGSYFANADCGSATASFWWLGVVAKALTATRDDCACNRDLESGLAAFWQLDIVDGELSRSGARKLSRFASKRPH